MKITKYTKFTKYELWYLYIYNKRVFELFESFYFSKTSHIKRNVRKYLGVFCVLCIINWYFWIWYSDYVPFPVYMKLKNMIFWKNVPAVWTIFVRNILGDIFLIWDHKLSPVSSINKWCWRVTSNKVGAGDNINK